MDKKQPPPLERLSTVLEKSLKRLDPLGRLDEYGVWPIWNDTVGATIARNAQPEKIRNGTLFVKVSSPVWMQQLQYMKEAIAEKLNARLNGEPVRNIFFFVGRVEADLPTPAAEPEKPPDETQAVDDERFLESIHDPEIRQAFRRILTARRKQAR